LVGEVVLVWDGVTVSEFVGEGVIDGVGDALALSSCSYGAALRGSTLPNVIRQMIVQDPRMSNRLPSGSFDIELTDSCRNIVKIFKIIIHILTW